MATPCKVMQTSEATEVHCTLQGVEPISSTIRYPGNSIKKETQEQPTGNKAKGNLNVPS